MGSVSAKASREDIPGNLNGRMRVVIEEVCPRVMNGEFAVKRAVGEDVSVRADIFSDGHEVIRAVVHYTTGDGRREREMVHLGNDRWEAVFPAQQLGICTFSVEAWIDAFATWHKDIAKKIQAGQHVPVDLVAGALLLRDARKRATTPDAEQIDFYAALFEDPDRYDQACAAALDGRVAELMRSYADRRFASQSPEYMVRVEDQKALCGAWYEFFPRSFGPDGQHGTLAQSEALLPDIAAMGFDIVYLPPIHPIGRTNRKGKNNSPTAEAGEPGSPWAIGAREGGHDALHPELGAIEDFERFIARARDCGLEVAMDIALQCAPDHPYVTQHPEWFKKRPDGSIQFAENPPKKYEDIVPVNFESENWRELWLELRRVLFFWMDNGVRIFRVDNPHTKPFAFWQWLIAEAKTKDERVLFLAEAFTRPKVMYRLGKIGFSQSYTYFTWRNSKYELTSYIQELTKSPVRDFFRPNFWPNTPDILPEYLQYGGRPAFVIRLVLAATLSANYGIYGPAFEVCDNAALPGREEYQDSEKYELKRWKRDVDWSLAELVTLLNRARRENQALQTTWNTEFFDVDNEYLLFYGKISKDGDNAIFVIVNLDPYHTQSGWVSMPIDRFGLEPAQPYLMHDLISSDKYIWNGERNYVQLDPHAMPAHVFRLHRRLRRESDFDYFM
jgi:starch synthase (maltosyl-transferring)